MSEWLRVNPIACDAHGLCAGLLPEMIALDEWGYPLLDGRDVPEHLVPHARRAVAACPTLALALVRRAVAAGPAAPARPAAAPRPASAARPGLAPVPGSRPIPAGPIPTGRPR
jgi:ferredoxin